MVDSTPVSTFTAKVVPELHEFVRPAADCRPHPDNARTHNLPRIAKSLNEHGQRSPIVVQQSTGYIVKGNGTWTAAVQILGWSDIAQVWQELTDDQAMAYLLADNKASDDSGYDTTKLVGALSKLAAGPGLLDTLWGSEELEDMVEELAGPTILSGVETGAEYADADTLEARTAHKQDRVGAKNKETRLLFPPEVYEDFVGWVRTCRKAFGTSGTVDTLLEAMKRQAEATSQAVRLGQNIDGEELRRVRRDLIVELRDAVVADPRFDNPTRPMILGFLEHAAPPVVSPLRVEEVTAFGAPEPGATPVAVAPDAGEAPVQGADGLVTEPIALVTAPEPTTEPGAGPFVEAIMDVYDVTPDIIGLPVKNVTTPDGYTADPETGEVLAEPQGVDRLTLQRVNMSEGTQMETDERAEEDADSYRLPPDLGGEA